MFYLRFGLFGREEVITSSFPDGTLHMKVDKNYSEYHTIEWYYESDAELFALICLRRQLSDNKLSLIMPYIPHARMDRVKSPSDVFTLKYFAEVINSLNFEDVFVLDAHSNVSLALIDRVSPIDEEVFLHNYVKRAAVDAGIKAEDVVLFFPDEGAMKRYSDKFELPYAFGIKERDWVTGEIKGLQLMNKALVEDATVLIIDDICSRGGTFYHSAKALRAAGAKDIYLYVSHAEKTMLEGDMYKSDLVKKIYTTDSLFKKNMDFLDKVVVMPITDAI